MRASSRGPAWALAAARGRVLLPVLGVLLVALSALTRVGWLAPAGLVLLVVGAALYLRVGTVRAEPRTVHPPVAGRWVPVNSPADKVPSHGLQAYGQTYAVDLVHVPEGDWTLQMGWSAPHTRPPEEYPGFGRPVVAPADGTVVRAKSTQRDHGARTSWFGYGLMVIEGLVLELTGRILGNHVVLDVGDGAYAVVAHLRRGSVAVACGDRVVAGQQLGECGNSGNTSEPHVHFQLMDRPSAFVAAGLPFRFASAHLDDGTPVELPRNGQPFVADPLPSPRS